MSRFNKTELTYRLLDAFEERYDTSIYDDHDIDLIEQWAYAACMGAAKNTIQEQLVHIVNGLKTYGHRRTVNVIKEIQNRSSAKKYELTDETLRFNGRTLHQIIALKEFELIDGSRVYGGDIGGWIESEQNLSQDGTCWIDSTSKVIGKSEVRDDAYVNEYSMISNESIIYGEANIEDSCIEDAAIGDRVYVKESDIIGSRCCHTTRISECKVCNSVIGGRATLVKCKIDSSLVKIFCNDEYTFNITNLTVKKRDDDE